MSGVDAPKKPDEPKPALPAPQPVIDVAQHLVRLAATCMAVHDIRYYLNGIHVEPREAGGVFIIATDGHRLMAVIDETGSASEAATLRVDRATLSRMPRPCATGGAAIGKRIPLEKVGNRLQTEVFRGKTAVLLTDHLGQVSHMIPGALVEGKFPDWRSVMPDFEKLKPGTVAPYNYRYLSSVLDVFSSNKRGYGVHPRAYQSDPHSAIVWHLPRHENACLIIMPMRDDSIGSPLNDLFTKNWSTDARRARRPAEAKAQEPVAVPAERGADPQERQAEAGQERAAAGPQAQAPAQDPTA